MLHTTGEKPLLSVPAALLSPAAMHVQDEDQEEIEFEDAHKIQIRRQALESWVNEPFFDEAVPGCLVLLTHRQKYMIGVIVGIEHREPGSYK